MSNKSPWSKARTEPAPGFWPQARSPTHGVLVGTSRDGDAACGQKNKPGDVEWVLTVRSEPKSSGVGCQLACAMELFQRGRDLLDAERLGEVSVKAGLVGPGHVPGERD